MFRSFVFSLAALGCAGAALAQTQAPPPAPQSSIVRDNCLLSAIANEDVYKDANNIQFRCFGAAAEAWFNQLPGGKEVQDPNGVFVARYFDGPGYCAHQIKNAKGEAVSMHLCAIDRPPLK